MPLCASALVTTTFTSPAAWAGVVPVMVVGFTTVVPASAEPPKVTLARGRSTTKRGSAHPDSPKRTREELKMSRDSFLFRSDDRHQRR